MARYDLAGKTALVTGAARGIGFATAKALAARGANVTVLDLDQDAADRAAAHVAQMLEGQNVLGPAPLFRLKDMYRSRLVVKAEDRPAAVAAVGEAVKKISADRRNRPVKLAVDVDPQ